MARTPQNGDFYIQRSNQDFWLREAGVWVRKGNIRDEGASGILDINPILAQGFTQASPLTRERFIEFDQAFAFGFDAAAVVSRSREVQAAMGFGVDNALVLTRTRELSVAINLGFDVASQFGIDLGNPAILDQLGFAQAVTLSKNRQLTITMAYGFSATPTPVVDHGLQLSAAMALGYLMSVGLTRTNALAAAMGYGYAQAQTLVVSVPLPATTHLYGYSQANTLTHTNSTPTRAKLSSGANSGTDNAAGLSGTFNAVGGTMIVIDITREGTGDVTSTTTVTDNFGLTWHQQSTSAHFHATPGKWYRIERWWAYSAASHIGMQISYTFIRSSAANNTTYSVYSYTNIGKANGGTPFLVSGSATATQDSVTASAVTANATPGGTSPTIVLGGLAYRDANTPPTAGSTYTQIDRLGNQTSSGAMSFINEDLISTSSISSPHAVTITSNQAFWEYIVDVIDGS